MQTARLAALALTGVLVAFNAPPQERGVTATSIRLGQSCALKGPAASLGQGMRLGLSVYFDYVNATGGVQGRRVELESVDDGYEPARTERVTKTLIESSGVFLLIGEVGTPTSKVAVPIAEKSQVPFLAPFTGAEFLRSPDKELVVNVRASYYQELERLTQYLVDSQGKTRIACFYQNDEYGRAGLAGIELALEKRGLELCAEGTYERNTTAVADGLKAIAPSNPEAVILVGAYKPCATFIRAAKANPATKDATFCNISFVGTKALLDALGSASEGCVTSQVMPFPWDTTIPVVAEFQQVMTAAGRAEDIDFITLEGFLAAKFFCQVAESIEGDLTRRAFLRAVHSIGSFNLGGVSLNYGPGDNQGLDDVFLTVFRGGEIHPLLAD